MQLHLPSAHLNNNLDLLALLASLNHSLMFCRSEVYLIHTLVVAGNKRCFNCSNKSFSDVDFKRLLPASCNVSIS